MAHTDLFFNFHYLVCAWLLIRTTLGGLFLGAMAIGLNISGSLTWRIDARGHLQQTRNIELVLA